MCVDEKAVLWLTPGAWNVAVPSHNGRLERGLYHNNLTDTIRNHSLDGEASSVEKTLVQ